MSIKHSKSSSSHCSVFKLPVGLLGHRSALSILSLAGDRQAAGILEEIIL